jgi:hypothetical protein
VGFNLPNISGIPLNNPLVFTFSNVIDGDSYTPDTVRVVGTTSPFFETVVSDGNLLALLPRSPNFEDYSDAGMAPNDTYSVSLSVFPAPDTIRTLEGDPLLFAEQFVFNTVPTAAFIEPTRPIIHGLPPSAAGRSDDEGCLQNPDNSLYTATTQTGSGIGSRLLCLKNEGAPLVILDECVPTHDAGAVGTPAVTPGGVDLPAIRIRFNEPLDPVTVVPWIPTTGLGVNVQLWRVGDTDKNPLSFMGTNPPAFQVATTKPLLTQSITQTEVILTATDAVLQGTYLVNITPALTDLDGAPTSGNPLTIVDPNRPNVTDGGYGAIEANVNTAGIVPTGYRFYFVTIVLPSTSSAFNESFSTNADEYGDAASGDTEPGVFTQSDPDPVNNDMVTIPGALLPAATTPAFTLTNTVLECGQSTTANWNNGFRFLGLPGIEANQDQDLGTGRLKAVWKPYCGDGSDGNFDSGGADLTLGTDPVAGNSVNDDGIYEYNSFVLRGGDTLSASGDRPLLILCRGNFTIEAGAVVDLSGTEGLPGIDTDGSTLFTNPGALTNAGGEGGPAGAGGGRGGNGTNPLTSVSPPGPATSQSGFAAWSVFGVLPNSGGGRGGDGDEGTAVEQQGGGGGGFGAAGDAGLDASGNPVANGGPVFGDDLFTRSIDLFEPDRGYSPNAGISGGDGGGGGGADDDTAGAEAGNGALENGDDGGGGGGGAGGGVCVVSCGAITVDGTIRCDGGDGGNTYDDNQLVLEDPDGMPASGDEFYSGLILAPVPSGQGGPGGGGAGGGILLIGEDEVTIGAGATLSVQGGSGGLGGGSQEGGDGGHGRVQLMVHSTTPALPTVGGTISPATAYVPAITFYEPTVRTASVGQSQWIDMFTPTADFDPAFWTDNFGQLVGLGLIQGALDDFDAIIEFQAADSLSPVTGLTQWDSDINTIDNKLWIRWRWRFFVTENYPGFGFLGAPMPSILEHTIPFERN